MKTELELRHLRVFVTLVELGSHTRAARALALSQSTVSETIRALERSLGTDLFRKGPKGSLLTDSGEALLPHARRILALTGELVSDLARVSSTVSGKLAVAAVESLSAYVLPNRLAELRERWPNARVEVTTAVCAEIRASVAAGRSDLGLVLESETGVDEESVVARSRLLVLGSPQHPLAGHATSPSELYRYDFYMSDSAGNYHQLLRQYFADAGCPPPTTQALGSVEGVKRGVLTAGTALGLLPAHAVERELADGTLVEIPLRTPLPGLVMRAVLPPGDSASPLVADLIQSLRGSSLSGLKVPA